MIELARAIRPCLPELVGDDEARSIDRQLADLLASGGAEADVEARIEEVLRSSPEILRWVQETLNDERLRPPHAQRAIERIDSTSGDGEIVDAERFQCPQGDFVWYRLSVVYQVPTCPTHQVKLTVA
ncbi:hypothetical protein ACIRG5_21670 [Lentzea sp. NPDC102401]|uniref:hypothetical protein n=1 Tax=Lentzea sp. NPDC102401 TaxID=3364128 RepID=UPI00381BB36A